MKKHSVSIRGHRTSFSLEEDFWVEFRRIAKQRNVSFAQLITRIDAKRRDGENLSSALRVFVLNTIKENGGTNGAGGGKRAD